MEAEQLLAGQLLPNEHVEWSGQPTQKLFTGADIFLVPFSILWGGFTFFWEIMALAQGAPGFFLIWGIPFMLMGLYFIFGRFVYKHYKKQRTYYVVTNQRVITITDTREKKMDAAFINQIPALNKSVGRDGVGTISFGSNNMIESLYGNSGMGFMARGYAPAVPAFYDIADAENVYQLVTKARQQG